MFRASNISALRTAIILIIYPWWLIVQPTVQNTKKWGQNLAPENSSHFRLIKLIQNLIFVSNLAKKFPSNICLLPFSAAPSLLEICPDESERLPTGVLLLPFNVFTTERQISKADRCTLPIQNNSSCKSPAFFPFKSLFSILNLQIETLWRIN